MELYVYDAQLTLLGIIDEISSLVWTRRYWACGEFALLLPVTERHASLIQNGRLIMKKDSDEAGLISYITIRQDQNGLEQIEAQGRFLTGWIGQRIIEPRIVMHAGTHAILQKIVADNLVNPVDPRRRIPNLRIADVGALDPAEVSYASEQFSNALDDCMARAQLAKLGFKITTDVASKQHTFVVYKGLNRTGDQTVNPIRIFSTDFDNILAQEFVASHENVASAVYVGGAANPGEDRPWTEVSDDARAGIARVECFYDASDLTQTYMSGGEQVEIPADQYLRLLRSRGEQVLSQKGERIAFSSTIDTFSGTKYGRDFDVGDRVTCVNRRWRVKIDARITEVTESYESGKYDLGVVFGVSLPTLSDMIRWR